MADKNNQREREDLLTKVSEMYYIHNLTQSEIARSIGLNRSSISRMLTEARERGIVEIRVRRPLSYDENLADALVENFGLRSARVLIGWENQDYEQLRARLGEAAAHMLTTFLHADATFGIAWGTTVSFTIDALKELEIAASQVVQLAGVIGSDNLAFNAQALVERIARKINGKAYYLYTPFIVKDAGIAHALLSNDDVRQTLEAGRHCDVALLGVGSTDPNYCSLHQGGHISRQELEEIRDAGAVGDVCARFFDSQGITCQIDFHDRLIGITPDDLQDIPIRLAVAGGTAKAPAILAALKGKHVNVLVTDNHTAALMLDTN